MQLQLLDCGDAAEQRRAAAGDNALLDSRAGGVHSIFDTGLLFLQFGFGGSADFDDGDAADQLGKALLELFLVVIAGGVFDLRADLLHTAFDVRGLAGAFDDRGVVLVDDDLLGATEVLKLHVLELDAEVFGDGLAAGEGGDVFEHGLAAVAKARGLDGSALQRAAEFVHHESRERFALDVFSDDQEGLAHLGGLLEQWEQILHRADFLFVDEDAHVFQHAFHTVRVGDEVGGEVAAVKLHAFDYFESGLHRLGFLDGDDAILADLLHGFGDDAADLLVVVGGNGANLGDHVALDVLVELLDFFHGDFDGLLDAFAAPLNFARITSSRRMRSSSSSILISVPLYLPKRTRSPGLTSKGISSPFSRLPAPTAITSPSMGFSFAESGMMIPPLTLSFSSMRFTMTRSWSGVRFTAILNNLHR